MIIAIVSIAIGAILVFDALSNKKQLKDPDMVKLEAEITSIKSYSRGENTPNYVYVKYSFKGKTRVEKLDTYAAGMAVGDTVEILIDPQKPNVPIRNFKKYANIILLTGIAFVTLGVFMLLKNIVGL